jgi:hypothetical protein
MSRTSWRQCSRGVQRANRLTTRTFWQTRSWRRLHGRVRRVAERGEDALRTRTGARNLVSQAGALPMLADGTREELGPRYRAGVLAGLVTVKWHQKLFDSSPQPHSSCSFSSCSRLIPTHAPFTLSSRPQSCPLVAG